MGVSLLVHVGDCFRNKWVYGNGVYWGTAGVNSKDQRVTIVMTRNKNSSCPGNNERKVIKYGETIPFGNKEFYVKLNKAYDTTCAHITIYTAEEIKPEEPDMIKPQIMSNHSDKLGYRVGDIIKSECVIKNIGGAGTIYLTVGVGYIDSGNMIFLTGFPTTDQLYLNYNQSYTFKEDVKVDITDYYRQQGIGWAYLQQQMYLFFLVGHKVNGDMIWDTERHIKIYLDPQDDFIDPTSLPEVLPDIDEAIEGFGGLGGLKWLYDEVKPDAKDVVDWVVDKITPEPKPEEEKPDMMPFIYIGYIGIIAYILIRSQ